MCTHLKWTIEAFWFINCILVTTNYGSYSVSLCTLSLLTTPSLCVLTYNTHIARGVCCTVINSTSIFCFFFEHLFSAESFSVLQTKQMHHNIHYYCIFLVIFTYFFVRIMIFTYCLSSIFPGCTSRA